MGNALVKGKRELLDLWGLIACPPFSTKQHRFSPLFPSLHRVLLANKPILIRLRFEFADSRHFLPSHLGPSSSYHISRLCSFLFLCVSSLATPSLLSFFFPLISLLFFSRSSVSVSALVGAVLSYSVRYRFLKRRSAFHGFCLFIWVSFLSSFLFYDALRLSSRMTCFHPFFSRIPLPYLCIHTPRYHCLHNGQGFGFPLQSARSL